LIDIKKILPSLMSL